MHVPRGLKIGTTRGGVRNGPTLRKENVRPTSGRGSRRPSPKRALAPDLEAEVNIRRRERHASMAWSLF